MKLAILTPPAPPSGRAALADAIRQHRAATSTVADARAVADAAAAVAGNAAQAVTAAHVALDAAKAAAVAALASGKPGGGLREARAALLDAEDAAETARAAHAIAATALEAATAAEERIRYVVGDAARDVLREATAALAARAAAAHASLIRDRLALRWLVSNRLVADWPAAVALLNDDKLPRVDTLQGDAERAFDRTAPDAAGPWRAALEALMVNPDAVLPT